ncbi:MAG TPA: hypothetical protein V6C76_10905 [Drouetiella sp.]
MTAHMDNSADNAVPSILLGDSAETIYHSLNRGGDDTDTGRWLTSLVSDALEIAAHGDAEQAVSEDDINTMVRWVAQIFNEFELYKIEFNSKAVGSDLTLSSSALNLDALSSTNDHFEGHLSTRFWSLAFDASTRKLDVYLIPAELLLAFTTNRIKDTEYKPFITFLPRRHSDQYYWSVENRQITFDMLPQLAKELFGDLIRVASGNVTENEFFESAPNHAAQRAQEEAASVTDRSFEKSKGQSKYDQQSDSRLIDASSVFANKSESGATEAQTGDAQDQRANETEQLSPRQTALTNHVFELCNRFSDSLDIEMREIIEFAKSGPENVALLLHCKKILTELDALRVVTNRTVENLQQLAEE